MDDMKSKPAADTKGEGPKVEGEGSYTATRDYNRDTAHFIAKKGKDIPKMAQDAEDALEGPEGDELRKAEDVGKSKARR